LRNQCVATFGDVYLAVLIGRTVTPPTSFNRSPNIYPIIFEIENSLNVTSGCNGISISVVKDGSYASIGTIKSYLKV
jgi:hypothetical protein